MNFLVILPLALCVIQANAADKQDAKSKTTSSPSNTIQQSPKYEMVYQTVKLQQPVQQQQLQLQIQPLHQIPLQHKAQYVPVQLVPRQYFVQQPQHAMIIIAQPALVPQSLVYPSPTQQLLNYFHSNPQAKYQLLHGNYQNYQQPAQQQVVQPTATYMHPVLASPVGNYVFGPQGSTQQPQLVAHASPIPAPAQYSQQPQAQQLQAQQLQAQQQHVQQAQQAQQQPQANSLAQLAQLAAQQYLSTQMKTAPAIVTGFEHFTPEQQAQIKAQLSSHLGTNFHAVSANPQYSSKYVAEQDSFVPSQQVKSEPVTTITSQAAELLKTRYVKGKN